MGFSVRAAAESDLAQLIRVQHDAFGRVAAGLDIPAEELPPLRETAADLAGLMRTGTRFWVAEAGEEIIGSVRARVSGDVVEIGRLVVANGWQRQGVATALMDALETSYHDPTHFELFTGKDARAPLALYMSRGYEPVREQDVGAVVLVWLRKSVARP